MEKKKTNHEMHSATKYATRITKDVFTDFNTILLKLILLF